MADNLISVYQTVLKSSNNARLDIVSQLNNVSNALLGIDKIKKDLFFTALSSTKGCRSGDLGIFLDTLLEGAQENNWSEDKRKQILDLTISSVMDGLENDPYPDNILFSLNLISTISKKLNKSDEFYQELDQLYAQVNSEQESIFELYENESEVTNPNDAFLTSKDSFEELSFQLMTLVEGEFSSEQTE